jgi:hypothetical protein
MADRRCTVLLFIFGTQPATGFEKKRRYLSQNPSIIFRTVLRHMQHKLWLACSMDGAGKCYSTDLSPCDFDLILKTRKLLHGIHFRTVPEIIQAIDHSI